MSLQRFWPHVRSCGFGQSRPLLSTGRITATGPVTYIFLVAPNDGEDGASAFALALGIAQGDVGILEELSEVLALTLPGNDPDARTLFEARPS